MTDPDPIRESLIADICRRLAENKPVRQELPGGGRLNIDRLLPFLCVYRRDPSRPDAGTGLFVTAEGSHLYSPGDAARRRSLRRLVWRIAETASGKLGGFLILEIWAAEDAAVPQEKDAVTGEPLLPHPVFRILTRPQHRLNKTVAELEFALQRVKVHRQASRVEIGQSARNHPPRMTQLISAAESERIGCDVLGLEMMPIYRSGEEGDVFEDLLRGLRRAVGRSLKKAFFVFALNRTAVRPQHYWVLGRKSLSKNVWSVDRKLADVSSQFKFLLLSTPVNAERSWHAFAESDHTREPVFRYRPLETDPLLLKRRLLSIPTERIEDPTLAHLFRQTQYELDRQITMLSDIGTRRYLPGSVQLYGGVESWLLELAQEVLSHSTVRGEGDDTTSAREFVRLAQREIRFYRRQHKSLSARAELRDDMYSGLLSTGGNLFVGRETVVDRQRVDALLQHEVGTHLLTYYNGQAQPLRLLKVGLAGYDALQEGLAVLSEYLVGGLSPSRMRTLAARVVAVDRMVRGASFAETFHTLATDHGFGERFAYTITLRVYRGGGLTKDAVYLRGLVEILDYFKRDGELDLLLVGKLATDHIPIIRELLLRGVLRPPLLRPRYLDHSHALERLERVRRGMTVLDLLRQ